MWIQIPDPPMTPFDRNNYGGMYPGCFPYAAGQTKEDYLAIPKALDRYNEAKEAKEKRKADKKKEEEKKKNEPKPFDFKSLQPLLFPATGKLCENLRVRLEG